MRGYSVVIGAVEAAITEHPLVSTAVVMTEGAEGSMDKKLVACIVPYSWKKVSAGTESFSLMSVVLFSGVLVVQVSMLNLI